MNKLFTTILAILAIVAFSNQAEAADNTSLLVNITVQIDHDLIIEWDGTPDTIADKNWALGSATAVSLGTAYNTFDHDQVLLDIENKTTVVPISLTIVVTDDGNWTHVDAKVPNANEFTMGYNYIANGVVDGTGPYSNIATAGNTVMATGIPPVGSGVPDDIYSIVLQLEVPDSVNTGISGTIVVGIYAAVV